MLQNVFLFFFEKNSFLEIYHFQHFYKYLLSNSIFRLKRPTIFGYMLSTLNIYRKNFRILRRSKSVATLQGNEL